MNASKAAAMAAHKYVGEHSNSRAVKTYVFAPIVSDHALVSFTIGLIIVHHVCIRILNRAGWCIEKWNKQCNDRMS